MVEPRLTYPYTSREEIGSIFSDLAVDLRADDNDDDSISPAELDHITDVIEEATDEVNQYLEHRYDPVNLAENRWVRRQASWLGAYFMSRRRGNAPQFANEVALVYERLAEVRDGRKRVPRLDSDRQGHLPAMTNPRLDYRFSDSKLRRDQRTSTGGGYPNEHVDHHYWGWGPGWGW